MKTLEHIIRDVVEGKCCCEKKKKSLEHTIRDKVEEAKVLSPGPQFKFNQFTAKNQQPGILNPPKSGGHVSQEGISASSKRNAVLQKKAAVTEKVTTYAEPEVATKINLPPEAPKNLPATVDPKKAVKAATSTATKAAEKTGTAVATKAAAEVASKGGMAAAAKVGARALGPIGAAMTVSDLAGKAATGTETGRAVGKWIGDNVPGAKTAADMMRKAGEAIGVRDAAPTKPEVKTQTKTAEPPTKPVETKTAPDAPPPVKAPPVVAPPVAAPVTSTATKVAAAALPAAAAAVAVPAALKTATKAVAPGKSNSGSGPTPTVSDKYTKDDRFFNKSVLHTAMPHRKSFREQTEVMPRPNNDRKSVEYVGRKKDTKARLATVKNIIDEAKKNVKDKKVVGMETKVFPTAIVNPELNKSEPSAL